MLHVSVTGGVDWAVYLLPFDLFKSVVYPTFKLARD
jgi:hypothetical protein